MRKRTTSRRSAKRNDSPMVRAVSLAPYRIYPLVERLQTVFVRPEWIEGAWKANGGYGCNASNATVTTPCEGRVNPKKRRQMNKKDIKERAVVVTTAHKGVFFGYAINTG